MRHFTRALALAAALTAQPLFAAEPAGAQVNLSAEASAPAANDLGTATLYVEAQDANPAELARRVNQSLTAALAVAAKFPAIKTKTSNTHTYPVYGKNNRIDGWRLRASLQLESRDLPALSELIGKLQSTGLMVGDLQVQSAPATRKAAEDAALRSALAAFEARAKLIADALGQKYRIAELQVGTSGHAPPPPMLMMRAAAMPAEAPPPIAAGESQVSVTVSGKIELTR